jgi:anaerobic magnesium-protoporphyrin IX monomethyl ester cyclase
MKFSRVLLIQPMHEKSLKTERTSFNFPWGIACISKYLQDAGYHVQFLDGQALQLPKEDLISNFDKYLPDVIGITAFSTQYNAVRYLANYVKSTIGIPVVVGGPLATYQPELVLNTTDVDICVIGEGEITAVDLLNHFDRLEDVKGIAYKKNGTIITSPPQNKIIDLDQLGMPDFSLFEMEKYLNQDNPYAREKSTGKSITFITSRGCPYSCHFCSKSSRNYRTMSPRKVYETLRILKEEFSIEEISFGDELFLASKKRFSELSPLLKSLNIPWGAQARVNVVDKEFLNLVKRSGCIGLGYGIESGSQRILDNMNKKITVQQIEEAMRNTKKLNIPVKVQLIFGYPGEDEETVQETIDLFRRVDHPGRRFNVITPLPGSKLYEDCLSQGLIKNEPEYLCAIEKSFGIGRVHVNFTKWPDDELYPRKRAAEEAMLKNYIDNSTLRRVRTFVGGFARKLIKY